MIAVDTRPRMVTGKGRSDTRALIISSDQGDIANPHRSAGQDYESITAKDVAAMAANPSRCDKMRAPWFIGSDYVSHDARSHDAQREHGNFHVLAVDIDKGGPDLSKVLDATLAIVTEQTSFVVYSSSSATLDNPKWRVLFFASPPILGAEYKETQGALFDLYETQGITCDRALERTGQLIFLPNISDSKRDENGVPFFYQYHLNKGRTLNINSTHPIYQRRAETRAAVAYAARENAKRREAASSRCEESDNASPVEIFNERHDLSDLMSKYGYERQGNSDHWKSPNQTSGSYATRVYENASWVSLSGSDLNAGIGAAKDHCCYGDAFDLFVHYEHSGDHTAAVRAYGQEVNPPTVKEPYTGDGASLQDDFGAPDSNVQKMHNATDAVPDISPKSGDGANEILKRWAFLSGDNEFYHTKTGQTMGVQSFNLAMAPHTGPVEFSTLDGPKEKKFSPSKTLIEYLSGTVAHSTMYRPDCAGDLHITSEGIPFINSYRTKSVPGADPHWESKDAWKLCEKHILNILSPLGSIVIQWMAHNVQFPGKKILWAPIIVGVQGDGKTTIAKMLSSAMGKANVAPVSPEAMFSEFTGWAEGSCVKVLEEIRVHGNSRHDAMNKLKPLITNDSIEVVRKGKDGKQVVNVTNYIALTNYMDALALDEGDRRWGVYKTKFDTRNEMLAEFDDAYWTALHSAIDGQPEVLRGWLLSVSLDDFNRVAGPDVGQHKKNMIALTRSPDQIDVEEAIAIGWHGVTETVLATDCLNEAIVALGGQRLNGKRLSNALSSAGWARFEKPIKWKCKTRRIWFKKSECLGSSSALEIQKILDPSETENDL